MKYPDGKFAPRISPQGHLLPGPDPDAPSLTPDIEQRLRAAFAEGAGRGLLHLGATEVGTALPPTWSWWRDFATRYVAALCAQAESEFVASPDTAILIALIDGAPPMVGAEYLTESNLHALWVEVDAALRAALTRSRLSVQDHLKTCHPVWNVMGRVHFNLAENRKDPDSPFAFLATYTSRISAHGKPQHLPLSKALQEFSDGKNRAGLLSLLMPVQRASEQCAWLRAMVDQGDIYDPLRWSPEEAYRFLVDIPKLESAGIVVRAPGAWKAGRPTRAMVQARVGARAPSHVGVDALLDFDMAITLDGEPLSAKETESLLASTDGLQWIRGRWVEVDGKKLARMLERFKAIESAAHAQGLPFAEAMRLVAGARVDDANAAQDADWSQLVAGSWLAQVLQGLRQPEGLAQVDPGPGLEAQLRPYQHVGVRWLYLLTRLRLGACLADDMGLGKTLQVLALLLVLRRENPQGGPSLLVAPASLLANWAGEAQRFCPSLRIMIAHPSGLSSTELQALDEQRLNSCDLVITSYGCVLRMPVLTQMRWQLAVLDEAQAIKNPGSKQTREVKKLKAAMRIALTGTPVENRLSDLWSIFDYTHPGLLGSEKVFARFTKRLAETQNYAPLRNLVRPYILRRLKTDKQVITDLPDKTEVKSWCHLSAAQAALYQAAVKELATALEEAEGIARKGLVLSYLMRFKQICNHPSQWLGDGAWRAGDSGKFARLQELTEVIAAKQEKVLVFTQFRETTDPLAAFLGGVFGREGLTLHGGTPVVKRRELVRQFQEDEFTPFFVLSLKAGGAGLNLTAASHVIHFDRCWNPAVENQATDRAYRIGQRRNVLVHKFLCRGTVEDRIDQLIESKQRLVADVVEGNAEVLLTELNDRELLDLVKLDIHAAQET